MALFNLREIAENLIPRKDIVWFTDIPKENFIVSDEVKDKLCRCAESWDGYVHADYENSYGEFARNKNRCNFEDLYINRRAHLADLAFYEIFIGGDKYLKKIQELIALICSERTWCVPAHAGIKSSDTTNHVIELYAAETASVLAFTSGFLGKKLPKDVHALIAEKVNERMFVPYMETDKYGWMGASGNKVNNWNPWINSNIMFCAALVCRDEEKYRYLVIRAARFTENYVSTNTKDCICDEGVRYWNLSGACLFDMTEILYDLCGGQIDLTKSDKVKSACDYITGMYDEYGHPANFADATFEFYPECAMLYRAGVRTENPLLCDMGRALYHKDNLRTYHDNFYRQLKNIYTASSLEPLEKVVYPEFKFLESINVCTMRKNGFFFSFKGNHNGESHNHCDVGSFVLYYDGTPLFIDPGVDLYSGYTFSSERNKLWYMRSDFHNVPSVAGELQKAGGTFAATPLQIEGMRAETDISGAYGMSSGAWKRSADFSGDSIVISDTFKESEYNTLNYMLYEMPKIDGNKLIFSCGVCAEIDGVSELKAQVIDISGKNPPDNIFGDAKNRKTDGRSYLIPRLFEKQWGKTELVKITAKPTGDAVSLKVYKI